jgi:dCTP deaminase
MILRDIEIEILKPVEPFYNYKIIHGGMSYGLSACGYDVRVAETLDLAAGQFALASTVERFAMPPNIVAFVHDKSTWARKGIAVQNTVIEPGWCGFLTLELTNHGRDRILIEAGMPIAQIIFHQLAGDVARPYEGKYQNQRAGAQSAILETSIHAPV